MEQNLNLEGFQQLDETSEYRETHYYSNEQDYIGDSTFWHDYGAHVLQK